MDEKETAVMTALVGPHALGRLQERLHDGGTTLRLFCTSLPSGEFRIIVGVELYGHQHFALLTPDEATQLRDYLSALLDRFCRGR